MSIASLPYARSSADWYAERGLAAFLAFSPNDRATARSTSTYGSLGDRNTVPEASRSPLPAARERTRTLTGPVDVRRGATGPAAENHGTPQIPLLRRHGSQHIHLRGAPGRRDRGQHARDRGED